MTTIRVSVTAEDIAASGITPQSWAEPVEEALGRLTGETVDIDGGDGTGNIATIGQGAWTLVIDLPEPANAFLDDRWEGRGPGAPFDFDIEVPDWIVDLIRDERPLLTLREAAAMLGIKPATLRQEAQAEWNGRDGPNGTALRLAIRKLGRDWFVDRVAAEAEGRARAVAT